MAKWVVYRDMFQIQPPSNMKLFCWTEVKIMEIAHEDIKRELLSYFILKARDLVSISVSDDVVQALIKMCSECCEPIDWCKCETKADTYFYGFRAVKVMSTTLTSTIVSASLPFFSLFKNKTEEVKDGKG